MLKLKFWRSDAVKRNTFDLASVSPMHRCFPVGIVRIFETLHNITSVACYITTMVTTYQIQRVCTGQE
jgi:hypothetical protein